MNDFDRFTEFLRREGAGYHDPPETPSDAMWPDVEGRLSGVDAGPAGDTAPYPLHALAYHEPPPAPRDEMWERIEAQWAARRPLAPAAVRPGHGGKRGAHRPWQWTRQGSAAGWAAALAAAASLVLGLALGRGGNPVPATTIEPSPIPTALPEPVPTALPEPVQAAPRVVVERQPVHAGEVPQSGPPVVASAPAAAADPGVNRTTVELHKALGVQEDYVATGHLGRAATLLTAFRIDQGTPASQQDLARWARELLVDTRMFLDTPEPRSPLERALLDDLELVLLQISRLGPDAPAFEWQLARESIEWKGTLMRLRAANATGET